jgi:hypothetical protein
MRVFSTKTAANGPLPLSSQTFCETEDVLRIMQKHVQAYGMVETLYVEYEHMHIPICHEGELRIVAQMAAAYNNSLIAENLRAQKDLYGEAYSQTAQEPGVSHERPATEPCDEEEWDEEKHGERAVYDEFYEQNEDILPWLAFKASRARKFGERCV